MFMKNVHVLLLNSAWKILSLSYWKLAPTMSYVICFSTRVFISQFQLALSKRLKIVFFYNCVYVVFYFCSKYGEIEEMNVCDNLGDHLVGNVYIKYRREEDAEKACKVLNTRWYDGMYSLFCIYMTVINNLSSEGVNYYFTC